MRHEIRHDLGVVLAKQAAEAAFRSYAERYARYQPALIWEGEGRARVSFQARGLQLSGVVEILDDALVLDMGVPLLLRPLTGKAQRIIDTEVGRWIERARRGAL